MITVKQYKPINKNGLIAMVDIRIHDEYDVEINGVKLAMSKSGQKFVSLPSREYTDAAGMKKYAPIVFVKNYDQFQKDVMSAIDAHAQNQEIISHSKEKMDHMTKGLAQQFKSNSGQNRGNSGDSPSWSQSGFGMSENPPF